MWHGFATCDRRPACVLLDSDAAVRRQTQTDNDASGSPPRVAGRLYRPAPTESQPGDVMDLRQTMNDERIAIGDVMAEPLWINGKSFTAYGLVRRGRSLTSQTAFSGQLPYKGSLGRPAANNGRYTQLVYEE